MTRTASEQFAANLLGPELSDQVEAAGIALDSPGILVAFREGCMQGIQHRRFEEAIAARVERGGHDAPPPPSAFETRVAERFEQLRAEPQYIPAAGAPSIDAVAEAMERLRYGGAQGAAA